MILFVDKDTTLFRSSSICYRGWLYNYDTSYADQNGVYTLLYNSSVGGCFLLYREASEDEKEWWNDKR